MRIRTALFFTRDFICRFIGILFWVGGGVSTSFVLQQLTIIVGSPRIQVISTAQKYPLALLAEPSEENAIISGTAMITVTMELTLANIIRRPETFALSSESGVIQPFSAP